MSRISWKTTKEASKLALKYPFVIKNLYNAGKPYQPGAGPRTLDSIISYLPMLESNKIVNLGIFNKQSIDSIRYENTIINIIVCLSQRDFPIGIHQRLLISLLHHGVDLNRVHWVITGADGIGHHMISADTCYGVVDQNNYNLWKKKYVDELNSYLDYFKHNKITEIPDSNSLFQNEVTNRKTLVETLQAYSAEPKNVHLFSSKLPWSTQHLIDSLKYDPFESSKTYVIGQTNTSKTALVRSLLQSFTKNLHEETGMQEYQIKNLKSKPTPFSSKFNVYSYKSIKIIDTPGYLRHGGSIWRHLNKFGAHFLHIPETSFLPDRLISLVPKIFGNSTNVSTQNTCFCIGGLVFVKPVVLSSKSEVLNPIEHSLQIKVSRNMPGKVETLTRKQMDDRMTKSEANKILDILRWNRYLLSGKEIEVILDNVGSFKAISSSSIPDSTVYWEVDLPYHVRGLSKITENIGTKFNKLEPITVKLSKVLAKKRDIFFSKH